ncbi:MAG: hypothetical protein NZ901_08640 [Geminocystis sp.]|nr:hypothetical protein [Geminocystis sp.]MCS7148242.1 hypothetical protein [Geminocystis sp.]MCX8077657.1 hypothetical protein [Geminocystis sp.]MDW8116549.1 hypothetical protein [Geminocystis sp.]MDW8462272.1 hypothetical protein [Geminocystis sp.]
MAKNKISPRDSWLYGNLLISLVLFVATYIVLGWVIASTTPFWQKLFSAESITIAYLIYLRAFPLLFKLILLFLIIGFSLFITSPFTFIALFLEKSINSDVKIFLSILFWSVVLVFVFCSFDYFADLLVITSANLLLRMDLQKLGYPSWLVVCIIVLIAIISFMIGVFCFEFFGVAVDY